MDIDGTRFRNRRRVQHSLDGLNVAPPKFQAKTQMVSPQPIPAQPVSASVPAEYKRFPLPRYQPPDRPIKIVRRRLRPKMLVRRAAAACLLAVFLAGGLLSWRAYVQFHKVFRGDTTVAALSSRPVAPGLLNGEGDGRVNIALLGIGGPGHDGPDLTDTIIVMSVDPVNNTAVMLSVPRDLWVKQPVPYFGSTQKINAVYESGKYHYLGKLDASNGNAAAIEAGFSNLDTVLQQVLGITINYHVLVDFQAFRQAIDTVGGVTVNVPSALVDPTMAWENHGNAVLAPAGVQQMDGAEALLYARSRETSSDFARSQRQRQILVALRDKVLTADTLSNPVKIEGLMNAFGDNIYSDISTQGASRLYGIMKKVGDNRIASIGLTDEPHKLVTTDHVGSTSVVRPVAGFNDYADIQAYVRSQLPDGYLVKEKAPVAVVGMTQAGAEAAAETLKQYGYNVVSTDVTQQTVLATSLVDLSHGRAPYTLHYLEKRYDTMPLSSLPAGVNVPAGSAQFVVVVNK